MLRPFPLHPEKSFHYSPPANEVIDPYRKEQDEDDHPSCAQKDQKEQTKEQQRKEKTEKQKERETERERENTTQLQRKEVSKPI